MSRYQVIEEGGGFVIAHRGHAEGFSEVFGSRAVAELALSKFVLWRNAAIGLARAAVNDSLMAGDKYTSPVLDLVARMELEP